MRARPSSAEVTGAEDERARSWGRLLLDPRFGRFFAGRLLASAGVWVHNIAAAVLAYELSGSAFVVGMVSIAQFFPQIALGPLSGAAADRGDRKRQMILGRVVVAGSSLLLALWLWLTDAPAQVDLAVLLVSCLLVGVGFVTGGPAMHAIVPSLVRPQEVAAAVTLNTAPVTLARAVGPVLGTGLAVTLGEPAAFAVAGLVNLAFAALLSTLVLAPRQRSAGEDHRMRAAVAFLRHDPRTARLLMAVAVVGVGADPAITLTPSISTALSGGAGHTGTFASAFGAGAGAGFLVIPPVRKRLGLGRDGTVGLLVTAAGLAGLVLVTSVAWAATAFVVAGIGMTLSLTSLSSQLQERLPDGLRGRIMALWSMGYLGSRPLAAAVDGAIADLVSVEAALVLVSAVVIAAAWASRGGRRDPVAPWPPVPRSG